MRISILVCAVLLSAGVAGCSQPPPPPPPSTGDCPNVSPGQLFGAPTPTAVVDQVVNSAPDGQPLALRLQYAAGLGVCIDGNNGDIHLYGDKAAGGQITLTFAPSLAGQASWPADATQAIQISEKPDGPYAAPTANIWNPPPAVAGNGTILLFTTPFEPGHTYYFRLQYLDSTGTLQTMQAKVINNTPQPAKH